MQRACTSFTSYALDSPQNQEQEICCLKCSEKVVLNQNQRKHNFCELWCTSLLMAPGHEEANEDWDSTQSHAPLIPSHEAPFPYLCQPHATLTVNTDNVESGF